MNTTTLRHSQTGVKRMENLALAGGDMEGEDGTLPGRKQGTSERLAVRAKRNKTKHQIYNQEKMIIKSSKAKRRDQIQSNDITRCPTKR